MKTKSPHEYGHLLYILFKNKQTKTKKLNKYDHSYE